MDNVDEDYVADLIENHKKTHEEVSTILKIEYPGLNGLSSRSVRRYCKERNIKRTIDQESLNNVIHKAVTEVPNYKYIIFNIYTLII